MTHHVVALPLRPGLGGFPETLGSTSLLAPTGAADSDQGRPTRAAGAVSVAVALRYLATKSRRRFPGIG
jgi:hypothetical protein